MSAKPAVLEVQKTVDSIEAELIDVATTLWRNPELSLVENDSAQLCLDTLQKYGFKIESAGTCGIPTAFVASFGSGSPTIGVMTEYDALPDLGNEAVPSKTPCKNGCTVGHGCGHNLIGAGGLGAAISLKAWMKNNSIPGTLKVFGAAAEESEGAKIYMARDGVFDCLDSCLHMHGMPVTTPWHARCAAVKQMLITFKGKSSHAGVAPWNGRSALHAAELFAHGIALMREHLEPTARTHYIYTDGGVAPNVVVENAQIKLFIRDTDMVHCEATAQWVKEMAEGCAMATQTKADALVFGGMHDLLPNEPLAKRLFEHMEQIGLPKYTREEQEFAKKLQVTAGHKPTGMADKMIPPQAVPPPLGGSTDVGEVSYIAPTMGILVQSMPSGCGVHTWQATACHGMSIGMKAMLLGAKSMASLAVDLFTDSELLAAAKADFQSRKGDYVFKSPLDPAMKRPMGLDVIENGGDHLHHLRLHDTGHDQHLEHLENHISGTKGGI